ncbi:YgjP-like metallopeptidase domain-containing protein [Streptomyces sp. TRM68367]|uniref:YgjP-like metallopeptidase domain-containing protein n=1 Tax=Streptomyces sp. TRM68367 TaxID=2758415 RepID=UPI00165BA954|nr:YgjP-like metallopeptidase domain-containing protein [Streptomyces sp. TRM68367]MBC9730708.1 DUF45 domain-containing protein [Streptomyces sp. TRM68367]
MPTTAPDITAALAADGRFSKYVHQVKISSRRRTLGLSIKPGEPGLTLHVPAAADTAEVITLLAKNSHRLAALILKARECPPDHPPKQLVNGSGFLWLGYSTRLKIVDDAPVPLERVHDGQWWMRLDRRAVQLGARPFIDWYCREGTAWLHQWHVAPSLWHSMAAGKPMPTVRVADIGRRRWGVHDGRTNHIRIAWQTLQLPPPLVRHVLVHEFTHAVVRHGKPHGPEFWRTFERSRLGAREEARRLNEEGRHVWMGDIAH